MKGTRVCADDKGVKLQDRKETLKETGTRGEKKALPITVKTVQQNTRGESYAV